MALLALFACSLCAELIANDKPLLVQYRGSFYVPLLKNYSETTFGGSFATAADYQDPWLQKRLADNGWACGRRFVSARRPLISPPTRLPFAAVRTELAGHRCQRRDVLARILYGTRISFSLDCC